MSDEMSPRRPTVSVVIPAWNEGSNIASVLRRLPENVDQVIVVDGHSVDGTVTAARAARPDVVVVQQARMGKGNALAAGFEVGSTFKASPLLGPRRCDEGGVCVG